MTLDRCTGVDARGYRCRRTPSHVHDRLPHRWWASHGNVQPSEWPVTEAEAAAYVFVPKVHTTRVKVQEPRPSIVQHIVEQMAQAPRQRRLADFTVKRCLDCPVFDAVLDRCRHPSMGKYGHDISKNEVGTLPIFCPLKVSSLTIEAA